jgi:hypothetical protein
MKLTFRRPALDDIPLLRSYFAKQQKNTDDYTLCGLLMWTDYFNYEMAEAEDTLIIRGRDIYDLKKKAYLMPLGAHEEEAVKAIVESENSDAVFFPAGEKDALKLQEKYGMEITYLPEWSDYTYDAQDLAYLKGKRFQKKRNLLNQFEKSYPGYVYKKAEPSDIHAILSAFEEMKKDDDKSSELSMYEESQVENVLKHFEEYKLEGGFISYQGQIIAFTFGEIYQNVLYSSIEKANKDFKGVYQAINAYFVRRLLEEKKPFAFVNRGEDVGDEGLRQAKMSYNPLRIEKKYLAKVKKA